MLGGHYVYTADELFLLLGLCKCYLFVRLAAHCSRWTSSIYEALFRRSFQKPGYVFAIKAEFIKRPALLLLLGTAATILMATLFLRVLER